MIAAPILLEWLVLASLALLTGFYATYGGICYWYAKRKHETPVLPTGADLPTLSVIVPTYNEASEVAARIENLKSVKYDRKKLQVVFVDGGSTDSTPEIIEQQKGSDLNLVLVRQNQREGYNRAIRDGYNASTGNIISITGAEVEYEPDALLHMIKHFSRDDVGVVTGIMKVRKQPGLSRKLERAYRDLYELVGAGESVIDSTWDVKGELNAALREVVKGIIQNPLIATKGCVDTCFSFQAIMLGLKTIYEPEAAYYENAPSMVRELLEQRVRRARVHIESMLLYKKIIFNRRYGKFGLIIAPAHFGMLVVFPFIFGLLIVSLALFVAINPTNFFAVGLLLLGLISLIFSPHAQAFAKNQLCLIAANLGLLAHFDDQRFKRLLSTRSVGKVDQIYEASLKQ